MGNIQEQWLKIKARATVLGEAILGDWGLFILVILAVTASFGLGRLSVLVGAQGPILSQNTASAATSQVGEAIPPKGAYVGSKSGDLYYFPWCSGATKIAPEMRRWFADEKAAQKAGYRQGKGCRGLTE